MNSSPHMQQFSARLIAKAIDFGFVLFIHHYFDQAFFTILMLVYLAVCDGLWNGQSLGKRIIGLRVLFLETEKSHSALFPYLQSAIRNAPFAVIMFLSLIPILGVLFTLLGLIFIAIEIYFIYTDEEGIRIGDIYAKTRVQFGNQA